MADKDITNLDEIKFLVDTFYDRVQHEPLIGPIFNGAIDNWPLHLDKMYRFWQTILLDEIAYKGSPFLVHAKLPLYAEHFEAWLNLWRATVDEHFTGPKADEAKWRAEKMGEMFLHKLNYYRDHPAQPII